MSEFLSEEDMRRALFGSAASPIKEIALQLPAATSLPVRRSMSLVSRLRVTLHVTKIYEGPEEVFIHDANTLSTLVAEAEAKAAAKKKKFRYFQVVSIEPVQI